MSDVSENVKSGPQWLRGLFMLLFIIIAEMTKVVVVVVAIVQFLFTILTGESNSNLTRFGSSMAQFAQQIVAFLTYNDEEKPFPFAPWPEPVVAEDEAEIEFGGSVAVPAEETILENVEETPVEETRVEETSAEETSAEEPAVEDTVKDVAAEVANDVTEETEEQAPELEPPSDKKAEHDPDPGEDEATDEQDEDSDKKPGT